MKNKIYKKGEVFATEHYYNECPCGKVTEQKVYIQRELQSNGTEKNTDVEIILSFCSCGNIIVSKYPMDAFDMKRMK